MLQIFNHEDRASAGSRSQQQLPSVDDGGRLGGGHDEAHGSRITTAARDRQRAYQVEMANRYPSLEHLPADQLKEMATFRAQPTPKYIRERRKEKAGALATAGDDEVVDEADKGDGDTDEGGKMLRLIPALVGGFMAVLVVVFIAYHLFMNLL